MTYTDTEGKKFAVVQYGDKSLVTRQNIYGRQVQCWLPVDAQPLVDWLLLRRSERPIVQEAFPHLSADEREFLITGLSGEEWDETFPEDTVFPLPD